MDGCDCAAQNETICCPVNLFEVVAIETVCVCRRQVMVLACVIIGGFSGNFASETKMLRTYNTIGYAQLDICTTKG